MNLLEKQREYLHAMGVQLWERRQSSAESLREPKAGWQDLEAKVKKCMACALHEKRKNVVFGKGNPASRLMFIGEGPGANEDKQGLPFVGRAGQLLDAMLNSVNLNGDNSYITNIVKCRPPNNRDPRPEEVASCTPYLLQQIEFIQPKLIVALGRVAAHYFLQTKESMARLRGRVHQFGENKFPLIVTYHPAYLLRNPADKAQSWRDLQLIVNFLAQK